MKCPLLIGCLLFGFAANVQAHRLDEYLQAIRIAVATNRVDLSIDLTPGVAVANQLWSGIDQNHDGKVSDEEGKAYARRVLKDLRLQVDEQVLTLVLVSATYPPLQEVRDGLGIIRIKAATPVQLGNAGRHVLTLTNAHRPEISVYLVNALVPKDHAIAITKQTRNETQQDYRLEFAVGPPGSERPLKQ